MFEGFFVGADGFGHIAQVSMAVTKAGPGAKVTRHEGDGFGAILHRVLVVFAEIVGDGPLIEGFGKVGAKFDGFGKVLESAIEGTIVQATRAKGQVLIGSRRATAEPDGPKGMFGHLAGHRIWVFEALGDVGNAAFLANQGECESGDFAGVAVRAGEEGSDLIGSIVSFEMTIEPLQVLRFQQRLDRSDELARICHQ